jgi:hypothetical protein
LKKLIEYHPIANLRKGETTVKRSTKRVTIKAKKGVGQSPESKARSKGFTGHRHTPEAKARIKAGHARRREIVENFLRNQAQSAASA